MTTTTCDINFSRILFCTDFSPNAVHAFNFAVKAAMHNKAHLYILHVMPSAESFLCGQNAVPEPDAQYWKGYFDRENIDVSAKINEVLKVKVTETHLSNMPEGISYEIVYRIGNSAQQIVDFAQENNISLAIIGRQGATGAVHSLIFGNVAAKVAREISCPILVVPPQVQEN